MKPFAIFFDIDGTILNEKTGEVSPSTKEAILKARENGHYTFINTGRSLAEVSSDILNLGFDGIVCGCGTYIQYKGEELFQKKLEKACMDEIVKDLTYYKINAFLEGTNYFYVSNQTTEEHKTAIEKIFGKGVLNRLRFWTEKEIDFNKFTIWLKEKSQFQDFYEKYKEQFEFIDRKKGLFEVVPYGFTKGTAIAFICEHLGISKEQTMALGDSTNDLDMLEVAHISIGMGNSMKDVLEKVTYVTKHIEEDGVEYALKHFGII